tara:strand:- start:27553 stop:28755 length:1203 start_codon:yes stop_codon:yes gene_type:complete
MSLQGIESIAIHGRFGDTMIGHLSTGEMVLPRPIATDPVLKRALFDAFERHETDPNRYTVGHYENSINPITGAPEFGWLSDTLKKIAPTVGRIVGYAIGGPGGAAIGGGLGTAAAGGNRKDIAQSTAVSYVGGNIAQGAGIQGGTFGETTFGEGISSLNPFGENFMLSKGNIGDPTPGSGEGIGSIFQDIGASGRAALTDATLPEGFKLGDRFKDLSALEKIGAGATALTAMGAFNPDETTTSMPAPSGALGGYLQNPLTPAVTPSQYRGVQGSSINQGSFMPTDIPTSSLASLDPAVAEFFREAAGDNDQYVNLMFPTFNKGGNVEEIDLRQTGGDVEDPEGSGDEDTINAKLADGEFVLTKQSVKGIGDGDHDKGIERLYDFMNFNENKAMSMGLGRA